MPLDAASLLKTHDPAQGRSACTCSAQGDPLVSAHHLHCQLRRAMQTILR